MNIPLRSTIIAVTTLLTVAVIAQQTACAQTPAQMEYDRQQREYRQQQEQQRQEQQRQQQLMNENARRQQEESRRLNAPTGQTPAPSYQGSTPHMAPQQPKARTNAAAATAGAEWVPIGSHTNNGGIDIYAARSTIRRSGNLVKMWDMFDYKTAQVFEGKRFLSMKQEHEYNCKDGRLRNLSATGFAGHMGKGTVVESGDDPGPWQTASSGGVLDALRKFACTGK
jgi:hypothetical protein